MKVYDFKKAKELIDGKKDSIKRAILGMIEDWNWTAETIFEDGNYTKDLETIDSIAGIDGSAWATPSLSIEYKDGSEETIDCYTTNNVEFTSEQIKQMKSYAKMTGGKPKS